MGKTEIDCDIDDSGKFECEVKKDGKTIDRIVGKDFSQIANQLKNSK